MCISCCGCTPRNSTITEAELDHIRAWLSHSGMIRVEPSRRAVFANLYTAYTIWAEGNSLNKMRFSKALTELGFGRATGTNGIRLRTGIGLLNQNP